MTRRPRKSNLGRALTDAMVCGVTGKRMYLTEGVAMKIVEKSHRDPRWINVHGQPARRAYTCEHCEWWHLTHKRESS